MPNWCDNIISGDLSREIIEEYFNVERPFEKILPLNGRDADEVWGTKWDVIPDNVYCDDELVNFSTAWTPPVGVAQELSKLIDGTITLKAYEGGCMLYLDAEYHCGDIVFENLSDPDMAATDAENDGFPV